MLDSFWRFYRWVEMKKNGGFFTDNRRKKSSLESTILKMDYQDARRFHFEWKHQTEFCLELFIFHSQLWLDIIIHQVGFQFVIGICFAEMMNNFYSEQKVSFWNASKFSKKTGHVCCQLQLCECHIQEKCNKWCPGFNLILHHQPKGLGQ